MSTRVAIALVAHQGCYVVGERGPCGPLAGYFEFPGGKCRPLEEPAACAARECLEETGLSVEVLRLRRDFTHRYPHGLVHLHFFDCRLHPGTDPTQLQPPFRWVPSADLTSYRFPEANELLVAELARSLI